MRPSRWWTLLAGAALFAGGASASAQARPAAVTRPRTAAEDLQLFSQVFNQIRVNHPDSLDSHRIFMAAIQAMVRATDPHSYVIQAVRLEPGKAEELRQGRLHPVPIQFHYEGGAPVVSSVAAGTQAARADILPGDELTLIDGKPVAAESELELEITLAGPRRSEVKLTFERRRLDGTWGALERTVRRERFSDESAVPAALMLDSTTGYVRITSFSNSDVSGDLRNALQRLEGRGMRRLVLDLRGNGGGLVDEAATIAGEFLPTNAIVYTSEGRREMAVDTGRVKRSFFNAQRQYPIILLIDNGTASASELVAGALQDHDRALLVGRPSFGKSLMMVGFPLSDGSVLQLVIGHIRTPCGRVIQRQYRGMTERNYRRLAGVARDTTGRPSCKTKAGRTVYGGGGIFPDVMIDPQPPPPAWFRRVNELDLSATWAGGFVTAQGTALSSLDAFALAPRLADGAADSFRAFAQERGVTITRTAEDDRLLDRLLLQVVAYVKWGNRGLYTVEARVDPDVTGALQHFSSFAALGIK